MCQLKVFNGWSKYEELATKLHGEEAFGFIQSVLPSYTVLDTLPS